ncbi:MAG TPA: TetR/AcrR family transcriptional regulator [Ideonella sp.]|uniref:TetR/AcrR family transcriptional regulator n=1 Tax=Ideonella sp. TaxID=1929293 RepID=UPI002E36E566|nr:TetR/AcrR family transcriptional regulator [Ideonella sp.]HEX5683249.1 TetR/AcrR family transcriptional regulator [Ideonella sp.]
MARPRSAGYADQRDQILAKASALFAQQGYTATSMNQVAAACELSKAALYHYVRDKHALLALVAEAHVKRLEAVVEEVLSQPLSPEARLRELIVRFVREYANAQNEHRVLTEDVKFLEDTEREQVLAIERRVVNAFADTVATVRPALKPVDLHKPLTMLLFGMINWMFTWLKPAEDGQRLTHEQMAPMVAELFFGGLGAVSVPAAPTESPASRKKTPRKETAL